MEHSDLLMVPDSQ